MNTRFERGENMASTIVFCMDNPIKTTLSAWQGHIGRASVVIRNGDHYEVLAYSDNELDFPELSRMARKNKAKYMKSILSEGVTAID
jgi:hypothetical protein